MYPHAGILLALVTSAFAAPLASRDQDPCAALSLKPSECISRYMFQELDADDRIAWKPSEARACFSSIPFDEDSRQNTLANFRAFNSLSIFQYNQLHDNSYLNQGVDIEAELSRIENATYASDFDFQEDLSNVVASLK